MLDPVRCAAAVLFVLPPVTAQLRLPNVFGDRMVLQRDKPVPVWGLAAAGAKVSVRFAGQDVAGTADRTGRWRVVLRGMRANATGAELIVASGTEQRRLSDVLVGEVWVCGGQSNMEWSLRASRDADVEVPSANFDRIRFLRLPKVARSTPQEDFAVENPNSAVGNWRKAIASQVENCTAVGYYFARRLHRRLGVPIGLIDTSWGGTMAQHWVTKASLRPIAEMAPYLEKHAARVEAWVAGGGAAGARLRFERDLKEWEVKRDAAKSKGEREPRRPNGNAYDNPADQGQPGGMWNGVGAPIARFAIRGVLFYQGENNSFNVGWKPFPFTFPRIISDWRTAFRDPKLPFGIIQIAGWSNRRSMTYDMNHHTNIVREVQFLTWRRTPHTGLIVTYDTNTNGSIHPARKLPVGERSARWALAEVYGQQSRGKPIEWHGPVYESMQVVKDRVVLAFEAESSRGLRLDRDVDVGFYIAGEDRVFHHARARVVKAQVEVWSTAVPKPVAVRYAWSNLPMGGLMNGRELPAYPFRTDSWPLVPHQSTGEYRVVK
jgi:sialate O-acetylesterase